MKKLVAILLAVSMLLCSSAVFAGSVDDVKAAYASFLSLGCPDPLGMAMHFSRLFPMTDEQMALAESYFNAIDTSLGVSVDNIGRNLASGELINIFANLEALGTLWRMGYSIRIEVPTCFYVIDANDGGTYKHLKIVKADTTEKSMSAPQIIAAGGIMRWYDEAVRDLLLIGTDGEYSGLVDLQDENKVKYEASDIVENLIGLENYDMIITLSPKSFSTQNVNGSYVVEYSGGDDFILDLGMLEVTDVDEQVTAISGLRTWISELIKAIKAVEYYDLSAIDALDSINAINMSSVSSRPNTKK